MHPEVWQKEMAQLIAKAIDGVTIDISVGEADLEVVVASSEESHKAGLSTYDDIPSDGMLFIYANDSKTPFTRQEMSFDIDIRFFDSEGAMTAVSHEGKIAEPQGSYRYVLETKPMDLEGQLQIHQASAETVESPERQSQPEG